MNIKRLKAKFQQTFPTYIKAILFLLINVIFNECVAGSVREKECFDQCNKSIGCANIKEYKCSGKKCKAYSSTGEPCRLDTSRCKRSDQSCLLCVNTCVHGCTGNKEFTSCSSKCPTGCDSFDHPCSMKCSETNFCSCKDGMVLKSRYGNECVSKCPDGNEKWKKVNQCRNKTIQLETTPCLTSKIEEPSAPGSLTQRQQTSTWMKSTSSKGAPIISTEAATSTAVEISTEKAKAATPTTTTATTPEKATITVKSTNVNTETPTTAAERTFLPIATDVIHTEYIKTPSIVEEGIGLMASLSTEATTEGIGVMASLSTEATTRTTVAVTKTETQIVTESTTATTAAVSCGQACRRLGFCHHTEDVGEDFAGDCLNWLRLYCDKRLPSDAECLIKYIRISGGICPSTDSNEFKFLQRCDGCITPCLQNNSPATEIPATQQIQSCKQTCEELESCTTRTKDEIRDTFSELPKECRTCLKNICEDNRYKGACVYHHIIQNCKDYCFDIYACDYCFEC